MARNAVTMGNAYVVIGAKISASFSQALGNIRKSLDAAGDSMMRSGAALGAIGGAITGTLVAATQSVANNIDNIAKASRRAGTSTEFMSAMGHAASLSGSSMEVFEKSIFAMSRAIEGARQGLKAPKDAIEAIGLSIDDLVRMNPEQQFTAIAEALSKMGNAGTKAMSAQALFGRGGRALAPLVADGAAGIENAKGEANRLGIGVTRQDAFAAEEYQDIITRLQAAMRGISMVIFRQVVPSMERMTLYLTNAVAHVREYLSLNPQWISYAYDLGRALLIAGAAITGMGVALKGLSLLASPGGVLGVMAALVLYMSGALDGLIATWGKTVMAFEVGGKTVGQWLEIVAKAWNATLPVFAAIFEEITATFKSVWDAFMPSATNIGAQIGDGIAQGVLSAFKRMAQNIVEVMYWIRIDLFKKLGLDKVMGADEIKKREAERDRTQAQVGSFFDLQKKKASDAYAALGGGKGTEFNAPDFSKTREALAKSSADVGEILGKPLGDALANVLSKEGSPVRGLTDIFKGLGQEFAKNSQTLDEGALVPVGAAGAAQAAKTMIESSGTFSAAQSRFFKPPEMKTQTELMKKQVDLLGRVATAVEDDNAAYFSE